MQIFFFFSFRKETWPILTSPLSMCLPTKDVFEKALWFHNNDKPFLMARSVPTVYLGLHFHTWEGNSFTNCPQTFPYSDPPLRFGSGLPFHESYPVLPFMSTYCSAPSRHHSHSAFSLKQSLPILTHNTTSFF